MQPSWLNNYLGGNQPYGQTPMNQPYGSTPIPNAEPNWLQQAIPSQTIQPDGATPIDWSKVGSTQTLDPNMALFAMKMLKENQPKAMPMQQVQNNIPMGRSMSYQDIMRSYGITGLMG